MQFSLLSRQVGAGVLLKYVLYIIGAANDGKGEMHCGKPSRLMQILSDTWSNGRSMCTLWYRWPTSALKSKIKLSLKQSIWNRKEAGSPSNSYGLILLTFSVFVTVEQFYILLTGGNSMTLRSVKTLNLIGWKENSEGHQSGSVPGKINKQTEEFFFFLIWQGFILV